jgi:2-haloacid dehalogenase
MTARWATFDCYGTLVDWQGGMRAVIQSIAGDRTDAVLATYYEIEPEVQRERFRPYRDVLAIGLERAAASHGVTVDESQRDLLAATLPFWPVFEDTRPALRALRQRGWKLAILSNIDRDLIERTLPALGAEVDLVVTAEDVKSYKPALGHFTAFQRRSGVAPRRWVHVACSLFHDVQPAAELGVPSVWIDREGHPPDPRPTLTLSGLGELADRLEPIVAH